MTKRSWFRPVSGNKSKDLWRCPVTEKACYDCDGPCQKDKATVATVPKPEPEVTARANALIPVPKHKVTVIKDHEVVYPKLYLEVFFAEESHESQFSEWFARAGCRKAKSIATCDLLVFSGGADVDPKFYDENQHISTHPNTERDVREMKLYNDAVQLGVPMFGVCRGLQFLHVMNGGKLYQDVNGHHSSHHMNCVRTGETLHRISSTHHQMVIPFDKMVVVAEAPGVSSTRIKNDVEHVGKQHDDTEAAWYPNTCCLGVQGHPEYKSYARYSAWCLEQIEHYIVNNPSIKSINNNYRFQPTRVVEVK